MQTCPPVRPRSPGPWIGSRVSGASHTHTGQHKATPQGGGVSLPHCCSHAERARATARTPVGRAAQPRCAQRAPWLLAGAPAARVGSGPVPTPAAALTSPLLAQGLRSPSNVANRRQTGRSEPRPARMPPTSRTASTEVSSVSLARAHSRGGRRSYRWECAGSEHNRNGTVEACA